MGNHLELHYQPIVNLSLWLIRKSFQVRPDNRMLARVRPQAESFAHRSQRGVADVGCKIHARFQVQALEQASR